MSDQATGFPDAQCAPARDEHFRKYRKNGTAEIVNAPYMPECIADSHAHIHMLADVPLALARAGVHGVKFIEAITDPAEDGTVLFDSLDGWLRSAQLDVRRMGSLCCGQAPYDVPKVRIAAGVHPHNAKDYTGQMEDMLVRMLHDARVSALGEIGLDYHYDLSPRDVQLNVFARQVRIAKEAGLPVILHVREAYDDAYGLMEAEGWPEGGVILHCYTSDAQEVSRWLAAGCYVAFGGAATFKSSDSIREAAVQVPAGRLLFETDSPYMAPVPFRGTKCEPAHTIWTADALCGVRGCLDTDAVKQLLRQTYENTLGLLDRQPTPWQKGAAGA